MPTAIKRRPTLLQTTITKWKECRKYLDHHSIMFTQDIQRRTCILSQLILKTLAYFSWLTPKGLWTQAWDSNRSNNKIPATHIKSYQLFIFVKQLRTFRAKISLHTNSSSNNSFKALIQQHHKRSFKIKTPKVSNWHQWVGDEGESQEWALTRRCNSRSHINCWFLL